MRNKKLEIRLQEFAMTCLEKTVYGDDDNNYQEDQLSRVIAEITAIYSTNPNLTGILSKISLIPSINDIGSSKIEKIGTSAHKCLEMLRKGDYKESLGDSYSVIEEYLNQVASQSQEACIEYAEKQRESIDKAVVRLLFEYMDEIKKTALDTAEKSDQAKQAASNVQKLLKSAEIAVNEAKESALSAQYTSAKARKQAKVAQGIVDHATNDIKKVERTADSIIPNMLTTLGIFVAIVIAVVACYLSVILTELISSTKPQTLPEEFMRYLIMGHIMLMTVFLFLYLIAKLTSRSITSHCHKFEKASNPPRNAFKECDKCKHHCNALIRLRLQYTYIFTINVIFLIGYVILGIWQVINVYYRPTFDNWMQSHPFIVAIIISGFIVVLTIILWLIFRKKKTK